MLRTIFLTTAIALSPFASLWAADANHVQIIIQDQAFIPANVSVAKGTVITWINRDDHVHSVEDLAGKFSSPELETDGIYSQTVNQVGIVSYQCGVHSQMTGRIEVKP